MEPVIYGGKFLQEWMWKFWTSFWYLQDRYFQQTDSHAKNNKIEEEIIF